MAIDLLLPRPGLRWLRRLQIGHSQSPSIGICSVLLIDFLPIGLEKCHAGPARFFFSVFQSELSRNLFRSGLLNFAFPAVLDWRRVDRRLRQKWGIMSP